MSIIYHHAIIVASWDKATLQAAHEEAERIFDWVSPISPEAINEIAAFFIPPDGSKEGWAASREGDARRNEFVAWLHEQRLSDGSSVLDWVEVQFGHDNRLANRVVRCSA